MRFTPGDYAELLGLYLGDGYICASGRAQRLRIFLDSRHAEIVTQTELLMRTCFPGRKVTRVRAHEGRMVVISVYAQHLSCVFPQHGRGMKHHRCVVLEPWQQYLVRQAPWSLLRGLIRSDGCAYINRTGPYRYLSYSFTNSSVDILDLFCSACELVGLEYRRYQRDIRIYRRASVGLMASYVGSKR